MNTRKSILTQQEILAKVHRLALQLAEVLPNNTDTLLVVGINNIGLLLAKQLCTHLKEYNFNNIELIAATAQEATITLQQNIDFNNKHVLLIDDVSNSGKTLTYALAPVLSYQPLSIRTLVLVERMYKTFAVSPDFVGLSLATAANDYIEVTADNNSITGAFLISKP